MIRYGLVIGMLTGLGACSNSMETKVSPSAATEPTVAPAMVRQVQSKLRDDGYYKQGSVDGIWGFGTESAVRSFQHDHNLGSSGQLDVPTLQALNLTPNAPVAAGSAPAQPVKANPPPSSANPEPVASPTNSASSAEPANSGTQPR